MKLPKKSTIFTNVQRDEDSRGGILSIVDESIKNVSIITCKTGSIRSNHYHHTDFHFIFQGQLKKVVAASFQLILKI